jgi:flagellar basal-body rod protein FlgG
MDGIELMASAMHAAQTRLDVSADNLANVSSDGFRRRLASARLDGRGISVDTHVDAGAGPLVKTGRALDLSVIDGDGMPVRARSGKRELVRSASFERDARGHLRDARGAMLLGACGPLVVSPDATIDANGVVRDGARVVDRLPLAHDATLASGFLERSNVDAVREMVDVVVAQRAFETAQKTLSAIDDVRAKVTSDVARVKS